MTDREIIEAMDVENRNLRADLNDMEDEIRKLTLALTRIDQIAQEMQKSTSTMVRSWATDIRVFSDESQRQDAL